MVEVLKHWREFFILGTHKLHLGGGWQMQSLHKYNSDADGGRGGELLESFFGLKKKYFWTFLNWEPSNIIAYLVEIMIFVVLYLKQPLSISARRISRTQQSAKKGQKKWSIPDTWYHKMHKTTRLFHCPKNITYKCFISPHQLSIFISPFNPLLLHSAIPMPISSFPYSVTNCNNSSISPLELHETF